MKVEIETKLKVESLDAVAGRLDKLGAKFNGLACEMDIYFDSPDKSLIESDRGLRLRKRKLDGRESIILTYKGPRQKTRLKSRQEIEVQIDDFEAMVEMLTTLGYEKRISFEKQRRFYEFDDCLVTLDELPELGGFVEIEGPDEKRITSVAEKLNLSNIDHIDKSYAVLMAEKSS